MVANALFVGVSNLALLTKAIKRIGEAMLGMNLLHQLPYFAAK